MGGWGQVIRARPRTLQQSAHIFGQTNVDGHEIERCVRVTSPVDALRGEVPVPSQRWLEARQKRRLVLYFQ